MDERQSAARLEELSLKILRSDLLVIVGVVGFLAIPKFSYSQGEVPTPVGRHSSTDVQEVATEGHPVIERREREVKDPERVADLGDLLIGTLLFLGPGVLMFLSFCFWGQERVFSWYFRQKKTFQAFLWICGLLMEPAGCVQIARITSAEKGQVEEPAEQIAAFFGAKSAQFMLGLMRLEDADWLLQQGRKADADQKLLEASSWFRKAAEDGHQESQYRLGLAYKFGHGVARDAEQAASWVRLAAEQGLPAAQILLGQLFFQGEGVPLDHAQAYMWSNLASVREGATLTVLQGKYPYRMATESTPPHAASEQRNRFASKMTPEQLAEGERLAREWFEMHLK